MTTYRLLYLGVLAFGLLCPGRAIADPISIVLTGVIAGPPKQIQVTIQDATEGLASVVITESDNATTVVPAFVPGDLLPLVITATKIDQSMFFTIGVKVTDVAGTVTSATFTDGPSSAPEPPYGLLLGSALFGIAAVTRKRYRHG